MPWSQWCQFDEWSDWDRAAAELVSPPAADVGYGSGDDVYGETDSPYGGD